MIPTISHLPLIQLASGDRFFLQIYKFIGSTPGKKAYIQANLHGAEIVGNAVIHQLIEFLNNINQTNITGEIWLVPLCNPFSTNQRTHYFSTGRFNIYDGKDWNRIFWDYEKECKDLEIFVKTLLNVHHDTIRQNYLQQIKQSFEKLAEKINSPSGVPLTDLYRYQLQSLCLDADYVIDIHSSSNQGIDYIYGFKGREESAKAFLLDYEILLNEYDGDAFDEAFLKPWLALEDALAQQGKPIQFDLESWTLELGSGMQMNPESVVKGVRGIKNYLAQKGILSIPGFPLPETATHQIKYARKTQIKKYYAPIGGVIQTRLNLATLVTAGERLYQIISFNKEGKLPAIIDVIAEKNGIIFDLSTNHSVNQAEYVLTILETDI
ncbi:succinylglutamate desuccinylase/aspartoacylase family protein [Phormidium sp. LEGE 05292]|uniref:succinylglutamate desuccinylase/aspartoacylase domain-containing protein n=1 Tax=[Phormidium] sp. LEGE 05292 TaxID=767427 RepID=UPI0018802CA1|nr:succinylglutamate desuccinylase/aspartoacylase family protein [Phormidium sp. LEGE 05292]MBE9224250.1 succinylglutamate desuccinylase/aspartoacylase family protein [Phormidium sp. LEGE 05292]